MSGGKKLSFFGFLCRLCVSGKNRKCLIERWAFARLDNVFDCEAFAVFLSIMSN